MSIKILKEKCNGCAKCVRYCPFEAILMVDDYAEIGAGCTFCNNCADKCPVGAIIKEPRTCDVDLSKWKGIWVFAEHNEKGLKKVTLELLGESYRLAKKTGDEVSAILLGCKIDNLIKPLLDHGADNVTVVDNKELAKFNIEVLTPILVRLVQKFKPAIFLIGGTINGRVLAPSVAVRLGTGLSADCTELDVDENGQLVQVRPAFGGNVMASILCKHTRPQMATVRPNVMKKKPEAGGNGKGRVTRINLKEDLYIRNMDTRTNILGFVKESLDSNLEEADIIVSGGYGLGRAKNFELVEELAHVLGGSVGASRKAVDSGWMPHQNQVGQTGKVVSPRIYIAIGISGSIQHQIGMKCSETIIAINSDPRAPAFDIADYGIVGDLFEVVPALIKEIRRLKEPVHQD